MIDYIEEREVVSVGEALDVLESVKGDLRGMAAIMRSIAESDGGGCIEGETFDLLADVVLSAGRALGQASDVLQAHAFDAGGDE